MADKYPLASGNWSNAANWNGGVLPGNDDDVWADGKTVTIDMDLTGTYAVKSLQTGQRAGGTAGGQFSVTSGSPTIEIVSGGAGVVAGPTTCIQVSNQASMTLRWATGGSGRIAIGGSSLNAHGANNASTGTINITGDVIGGSAGNTAFGAGNTSTGTINITGDVTGGYYGTSGGAGNTSSGTINITGDVTGGYSGTAYGAYNYSSGTINITGDCYNGAAPAVYNNTGVVDINGFARHNSANLVNVLYGASLTAGKIIVNGLIADATNKLFPGIIGRCFVRDTSSYIKIYDKNDALRTYVDSTGVNNPPDVADVRNGVKYGTGDAFTGTCHVPSAASVLYGVPVDNTVGTATIDAASIASAVWNALRSSYSTTGTFGAVSEWAGGGGGSNSISGTVVSDSGNNSYMFKTDLSGTLIKYVGMFLQFDSTAAAATEIREIVDFNPTTQVVTVNKSFSVAPAAGDTFKLIGYSGR